MKGWLVLGSAVALGLGVFGIYDEYFVFIEFLKGAIQPIAILAGLVAIMAGLFARKLRMGHVIVGVLLLAVGIYGSFDEYFATIDFLKGVVPPVLLVAGVVCVVTGVKRLT